VRLLRADINAVERHSYIQPDYSVFNRHSVGVDRYFRRGSVTQNF
jgi:hypothetical protein